MPPFSYALAALQKHVGIIADLVEKNQAAGTAAELKILKDQIAELKDIINGLWERNPYSENDELKREVGLYPRNMPLWSEKS